MWWIVLFLNHTAGESICICVKWGLVLVQHTKRKGRFNSGAARRANNADYLLTVCLCVNTDCVHKVEITLARATADPFLNIVLFHCLQGDEVDARYQSHMCTGCLWNCKLTEKSNGDNDGERLYTSKWMELHVLQSACMVQFNCIDLCEQDFG